MCNGSTGSRFVFFYIYFFVCVFSGSSWTGRTGYVQEVMKEDGIRLPRNSGVLVCGHQAMGEEVKAIALAAGVLDGRVLSNF